MHRPGAAAALSDEELMRSVREADDDHAFELLTPMFLAFYAGLTHAQIAELPALPPETINGRMRLGHKLRGVIAAQPTHHPLH